MSKKRLIDMMILVFAYLIAASFPFGLFIKGDIAVWLVPVLQLVMQLGFLLFWIFFIPKTSLNCCKIKVNLKNYCCLIPVFLLVGSNFIFAAIVPESFENTFHWSIGIKFVLNFVIVTNEEFIFRYIMLGNFDKIKHPLAKIAISSAVFALCHIGAFLNSFNPIDLLVVAYTFGIGAVLGIFYFYAGAPCTCIVYHLMFNIINGLVFESCFNPSNEYLTFIIVNLAVSAAYAIYLTIIYFVRLRKCEVYNVRGELL